MRADDQQGLPAPSSTRAARYEVDFFWPAARLVVEVDGEAYHSSHEAFIKDRRKDVDLRGKGYNVYRFTWVDIVKQPEATAIVLHRILEQAGS